MTYVQQTTLPRISSCPKIAGPVKLQLTEFIQTKPTFVHSFRGKPRHSVSSSPAGYYGANEPFEATRRQPGRTLHFPQARRTRGRGEAKSRASAVAGRAVVARRRRRVLNTYAHQGNGYAVQRRRLACRSGGYRGGAGHQQEHEKRDEESEHGCGRILTQLRLS